MDATYNPWLVTLSIVIAVLASYTAIDIASRLAYVRSTASKWWLAAGAVIIGCGIWATHFVGLLAFSLPIPLTYDLITTLKSLGIAIAASGFALWVPSGPNLTLKKLCFTAPLVGAGMSVMHFSDLSGAQILPAITYEPQLLVLSVTIAMAAAFATLWLFFNLRRGRSLFVRLTRVGAAVILGFAISGAHYTGLAAAQFAPHAESFGKGGANNGWIALTLGMMIIALLAITTLVLLYHTDVEHKTRKHNELLERTNRQLQHAATHDSLTRLPNRLLLTDRIGQTIARCTRYSSHFALMVLDLDRFKSINDSLGHLAGDEVLQEVASRLKSVMRKTDTVTRFGGDEFVMIVDEILDPKAAEVTAIGVLEQLRRPMTIRGIEVQVSASIGVSMWPNDGASAETLLKNADAAVYHAKKSGRNLVQFFTPAMNANALERIELEGALRRALINQEFQLHYQPKVDVATGRIEAAEALIRWRHPTRGLIPPGTFISLAEETGLIIPMGEWVLFEACQQLRAWHSAGLHTLRMAVNLSAQQFRQRALFDIVNGALARAQLDPQYLELELTESAVIQDADQSAQILRRLSEIGVRVAVDDFGTGYSSLNYLRRLPLDKLKIDRSFIREITTSRDDAEIVRAIVTLAHSLRLKVIAEGVETAEQLAFLRKLGCDLYQGYLCSPPVAAAEFDVLVRDNLANIPNDTVVRLGDTMRNRILRLV